MNDSFWVVELFENGKSSGYWDGGSSRSFTLNIHEAVQFRRQQDAARVTQGWHWNDTRITEHLMLPGPDKQPQTYCCPECNGSL